MLVANDTTEPPPNLARARFTGDNFDRKFNVPQGWRHGPPGSSVALSRPVASWRNIVTRVKRRGASRPLTRCHRVRRRTPYPLGHGEDKYLDLNIYIRGTTQTPSACTGRLKKVRRISFADSEPELSSMRIKCI